MLSYIFYSLVTGLLFIYLGLGLSFLILPLKFEKYSIFFAPFFGITYIAFLGWNIAQIDVNLIINHKLFLLIPPFFFLLISLLIKKERLNQIIWPLRKENLLNLIVLSIIYLFVSLPHILKYNFLTTISLGNNDIAFYATAAKSFMNQSLTNQYPYLDNNFLYPFKFEYHFTSSLCTSLISDTFAVEPYQIINIIMNLFFIFGIAIAFIVCYELFSYNKILSLFIASLIGINFHLISILYNGFYPQVLSIGFFLGLILAVYYPIIFDNKSMSCMIYYLPFALFMLIGLSAIYSTMQPFFAIPLLIFLILCIIAKKSVIAIKKEFLYLLSLLISFIIICPSDVILFINKHLFHAGAVAGWNAAIFSPELIFGIVFPTTTISLVQIRLQTPLIMIIIISAIILILCYYSLTLIYKDNKKLFLFSISNLLFVFILYIYFISIEYLSPGFTGEGYKAYKLMTYFIPIILISCLYFFTKVSFPKLHFTGKNESFNLFCVIGVIILVFGNILSASAIIYTNNEIRFVDNEMEDINKISLFDNVTSVNIDVNNYWEQMWVYYFLFNNKKLYLLGSSYYSPKSTKNSEWTLIKNYSSDDDIYKKNLNGEYIILNQKYSLVKQGSYDISLGQGWFNLESWGGNPGRWMSDNAEVLIYSNKNGTANLSITMASINSPKTLNIIGENADLLQKINIPTNFTIISIPIQLQKGENIILLNVPEGYERPCDIPELQSKDTRQLSIAAQNLTLVEAE